MLSKPTDAANLTDRFKGPGAGRRPPVHRAVQPISYRDGRPSVIVSASDGNTAVTARYTTGC